MLRTYMGRIYEQGIVEGVRGEAWLVREEGTGKHLALTFGTLTLCLKDCVR